MWTVAQDNLILLVVALLIGLAVALWAFRRRGARPDAAADRRTDGPEGNALHDEFAAATQDVAGEIFGVDAHPNIPGPSGPPDNLRLLKGVGPKLVAQLNEFGITRFDQLAGLTENEVALLDKRMGAFEGRIAHDRLVEQACYLERGDTDGFEAKFGKLGGGA
jgi:predicted flap endonuclease-1-like 5' DNA nuclease